MRQRPAAEGPGRDSGLGDAIRDHRMGGCFELYCGIWTVLEPGFTRSG